MANAKIDENRKKTAIAVDATNTIRNLLVDTTTNRLLITITMGNGSILNTAKIDENREWVSQAVDENDVIRPLLVDSSNNLLIDLLLE